MVLSCLKWSRVVLLLGLEALQSRDKARLTGSLGQKQITCQVCLPHSCFLSVVSAWPDPGPCLSFLGLRRPSGGRGQMPGLHWEWMQACQEEGRRWFATVQALQPHQLQLWRWYLLSPTSTTFSPSASWQGEVSLPWGNGVPFHFRRSSAWLEIAPWSHQCRLCSSWQKWKRHLGLIACRKKTDLGLPISFVPYKAGRAGWSALSKPHGSAIIMSISQIRARKLSCLPETYDSCTSYRSPIVRERSDVMMDGFKMARKGTGDIQQWGRYKLINNEHT